MFKIYDLNMKEIPLPKGVMPLEIFVGSVAKDRVTEAVEGRTGVVNYGFNYTDRPVSLFLRIKAADAADFRLLRNEVFATFDVGSAFYVAETDVPSRVLKVVVDESYIPDRLTEEYADFDINCRTLDSVFWESIYTTLELHDSGYSATAEKYGLVDNIDDEKVQYRFTENNFTVYNAGNVAVEPESMYISILFYYCSIPDGKMTVKNLTTGDTLIINSTENRKHIRQDGMVFTIGGVNRFRDTNRSFISLAPGDNRFEITGTIFDEARIDFKYYYK